MRITSGTAVLAARPPPSTKQPLWSISSLLEMSLVRMAHWTRIGLEMDIQLKRNT